MIQECHRLYWKTDRPEFIASLKELLREKRAERTSRRLSSGEKRSGPSFPARAITRSRKRFPVSML